MSERVIEHRIDKTGWDDGPWISEPDRLQWRTEAGLPGLIVRNHFGSLCGYAAVPPDHPLHSRKYEAIDVDVHGGLNYSDCCMETGPVCHVPDPGEPADVWWFGFDCGHAWDLQPGLAARERGLSDFPQNLYDRLRASETYRDLAYVRAEVESLARQLVKS